VVKFQHFAGTKANKSLCGFLSEYKPAKAIIVSRDFWARMHSGSQKLNLCRVSNGI
jgi:hypothetical protein